MAAETIRDDATSTSEEKTVVPVEPAEPSESVDTTTNEYPSGSRLAIIIAAIILTVFILSLDMVSHIYS